MADESPKKARASKRSPKPRKPRNNAARKAALDHQREHPGTRYIAAHTEVTRPPTSAPPPRIWYEDPRYHSLLNAYGLALSDQFAILGHWAQMREHPNNVAVPIGLAGTAQAQKATVLLPFGTNSRHYAVVPPFTDGNPEHAGGRIIQPLEQRHLALAGLGIIEAMLTSLLASCDRELLSVWLIGNRNDLRGYHYVKAHHEDRAGLIASGPVDALWDGLVCYWPDPYYTNRRRGMVDWVDYDRLGAELDRRRAALSAAGVVDHESWLKRTQHNAGEALPHLLVITSYPPAAGDRAILRSTLECGPNLGVHVMVVADSLAEDFWQPLSAWCDMVITSPDVTSKAVPGLPDVSADASAYRVFTPTVGEDAARVAEYEPFLDTGNGLWLPVYGANALHTGAPMISLSIPADRPVQMHLAATRAHLEVASRDTPTPDDLLASLIGDRQVVSLTDVAIVGPSEDTAAIVRGLVAQLPSEIARATVCEQNQGVRMTLVPPPAGNYFPLPPSNHRIIEARCDDELPALNKFCYRIDVLEGGQKLVVLRPEDFPRARRMDVITDGSVRTFESRPGGEPELLAG